MTNDDADALMNAAPGYRTAVALALARLEGNVDVTLTLFNSLTHSEKTDLILLLVGWLIEDALDVSDGDETEAIRHLRWTLQQLAAANTPAPDDQD